MRTYLHPLFFIILFTGIWAGAHAQNTQNIRGTITDADTGQPLIGATVRLLDTDLGTTTDTAGRYRLLEVPVGRYRLQVSYVGYQTIVLPEILLESGKELIQNLALSEQTTQLAAVVVRAPRSDLQTYAPNVRTLTVEETLRFPATFFDPARLATTFAGVTQANDQANGISIRGNSPNGLLWRLEGVDIVNPNHTPNAGTFSDRVTASGGGTIILSAQLLATSYFHTGAFPVEYGNALGGVMDMRLRRGNNQRSEFTGQAGLIGLDIATEGPFAGDSNASYLVNYRYSFVGLLNLLGVDVGDEDISFQDLSFNLVFPGKKGSELTLFGMAGLSENIFKAERDSTLWEIRKDRYDIIFRSRMGALGGTYTQPVGHHGLWQTAAAFSILSSTRTGDRLDAAYQPVRLEDDDYEQSKLSLHSYYQHKLSAATRLRFGLHLTRHDFDIRGVQFPNKLVAQGKGGGWLYQPYLGWQSRLAAGFNLNAGLHFSYFAFNQTGAVEPRASVEWTPGGSAGSLSLSYGLHSQLQQPQLYFAVGEPLADNRDLGLTRAHHLVLGYHYKFSPATRFSTELYYQSLFDVPIAANAANAFSALNLVEGFVDFPLVNEGTGTNYGLELSLQRYIEDGLYYLFNATWYQSKYKGSDGIGRDTRFNGNYLFNATFGREWKRPSKKGRDRLWGANLRVAYIGGFRDTPIDEAASQAAGTTVYDESMPFSIKQQDYYRADLRLYFKRSRQGANNTFSIDIQNLTNARNESFRYYDVQANEVIVQDQLGLIPILNYRVEF